MEEFPVTWCYCERCPSLHTSLAQTERFCEECGSEVVPCPTCVCGKEFNPNHTFDARHFCAACGVAWTVAFRAERARERLDAYRKVQYRTKVLVN